MDQKYVTFIIIAIYAQNSNSICYIIYVGINSIDDISNGPVYMLRLFIC